MKIMLNIHLKNYSLYSLKCIFIHIALSIFFQKCSEYYRVQKYSFMIYVRIIAMCTSPWCVELNYIKCNFNDLF